VTGPGVRSLVLWLVGTAILVIGGGMAGQLGNENRIDPRLDPGRDLAAARSTAVAIAFQHPRPQDGTTFGDFVLQRLQGECPALSADRFAFGATLYTDDDEGPVYVVRPAFGSRRGAGCSVDRLRFFSEVALIVVRARDARVVAVDQFGLQIGRASTSWLAEFQDGAAP
jgi:hypothetical protein